LRHEIDLMTPVISIVARASKIPASLWWAFTELLDVASATHAADSTKQKMGRLTSILPSMPLAPETVAARSPLCLSPAQITIPQT
jgi:hypothetical protein